MYIHNIHSIDNYINAFRTTFILSIITYKYICIHTNFFLDLHELDSQNIYIYGRMSAQREKKNGTVNHLRLEVGDITVCEKR